MESFCPFPRVLTVTPPTVSLSQRRPSSPPHTQSHHSFVGWNFLVCRSSFHCELMCMYTCLCVCMFMLYNTYKAQEGLKKTDESVVGRGRWNRLLMCFYPLPNSTNPQHTSYPDVIRINGKTTRRALTGLTDFIAKLLETTTSETFLKIIYQVFGRSRSELYKIY